MKYTLITTDFSHDDTVPVKLDWQDFFYLVRDDTLGKPRWLRYLTEIDSYALYTREDIDDIIDEGGDPGVTDDGFDLSQLKEGEFFSDGDLGCYYIGSSHFFWEPVSQSNTILLADADTYYEEDDSIDKACTLENALKMARDAGLVDVETDSLKPGYSIERVTFVDPAEKEDESQKKASKSKSTRKKKSATSKSEKSQAKDTAQKTTETVAKGKQSRKVDLSKESSFEENSADEDYTDEDSSEEKIPVQITITFTPPEK